MEIGELVELYRAAKKTAMVAFLAGTVYLAIIFALRENWQMFGTLCGMAIFEAVVFDVKRGLSIFGILID